ncbi:MAG: hypothetical protein KF864_00515 [Phycisphaeraceae bacterium]|nr:hypothetical protein [Phycisphaeraceae bacterium]
MTSPAPARPLLTSRAGVARRLSLALSAMGALCAAALNTVGCASGSGGAGDGGTALPLRSTAGVDVLWLSVDDSAPPTGPAPARGAPRVPLAQALGAVGAAPPEVRAQTLESWTRAGLAAYTIPVDRVPSLRSLMREAGATQNQAFGVTLGWSEIFRGAVCTLPQPVDLGSGPTELRAGFFRLLMRCYPVPVVAGASCRVEVLPQLIDTAVDRSRATGHGGAVSQGMIFPSLLLEIDLPEGVALVITSDPLSDAASMANEQNGQPPGDEARPRVYGPTHEEPDRPRVYGPTPDDPHSLGQAMMTRVLSGGSPLSRSVLIFIPRPGRPVTLLGD